jgi:hypothetical protein
VQECRGASEHPRSLWCYTIWVQPGLGLQLGLPLLGPHLHLLGLGLHHPLLLHYQVLSHNKVSEDVNFEMHAATSRDS